MLEKFRKALDKGGDYATLFTDLPKASDCIAHDLIIAKLHEYGFDMLSLSLMNSYLTNSYQSVKINNSCSLWTLIKYRVSQGSVLDTVLFNRVLCDLFFIINDVDVASYVDITLHKKWSFQLRISSVNVKKSAVSCGFGHIY